MKPMSYTEARANFASVLDSATEDLEEVVVTRAGHEPAVVVALSEYQALQETAYLLGNPANARHLERSIAEHRGGIATPRELVDIDEDEVGEQANPQRRKVRLKGPRDPHLEVAYPGIAVRWLDLEAADRIKEFAKALDPDQYSSFVGLYRQLLTHLDPEAEREVARRKVDK
ncbi:type II toxin-antitoxin system prevent-host-death family antitoxin [Nocardia sp. NPDC050713]|uniref:type II toxin-antitoxin system Phd/YefM family antitoxin n=1 Tax=Nocardia sp. NPDC050713 TaxID=3154511 RepID=UPI0033EB1B93